MGTFDMWFCDKCGKVWSGDPTDKEVEMCSVCGNVLRKVPEEYLIRNSFQGYQFPHITKEMEEKLINDLVLPSPNFDQYYFDHREEINMQQHMEMDAILENYKAKKEGRDKGNKYGVSCPYCHATNVQKISGMTKAGHIALFGIFGVGKAGKQWHCTHCGSDF